MLSSSTHKYRPGTLLMSKLGNFLKYLWLKILLALTEIRKYHSYGNKLVKFNVNAPNHQQQNHNQKKQLQHSNTLKKIPEVKGLPVVGTLFHLLAAGAAPKLHIYIDKRHRQYGDIFRERLGGTQDAIFVSSAHLMRSVFQHEGSYPRHPLPDAWILYNQEHNCQRGLFFMEGEEWFHNRRLLSRVLLSGNLNWMDWHVRQCTNKLIAKWKEDLLKVKESSGYECMLIDNVEQQLYRWSIDVVISVMFGTTASEKENADLHSAVTDFSQIVHKIFESSSKLMNFPPKIAKKYRMKIWTDFEDSVQRALSQGCRIIDMYLQLCSEYPDGLYGKLKESDTPLDMIKRLFVDLVIAAGDTTAFSSAWALYLLSKDNKLQHKIHEEQLDHSNVHDMPLVRGLVKETLRLYPVAPFIGRYLPEDAKIDKYFIKKDSLVLLSLYTAGRDPKHFPDPLEVMPERWLRDEHTGDYKGVYKPHASLPFAIGNRSCIGRKLALSQMQYLIAEITKNFKLSCENTTPIESILRLVTVPNQPLILGLCPRIT
uniref:Cytochrome P450 n=1 Tax=Musca domestica TaxID=7370 RepID=A0A1I8N6Z5_MUSDO